jgi:hypothetical protein
MTAAEPSDEEGYRGHTSVLLTDIQRRLAGTAGNRQGKPRPARMFRTPTTGPEIASMTARQMDFEWTDRGS